MNRMQLAIAVRYIIRRRRQTIICMLGVAIGVAIFIAMNAMMKGFEVKFIQETVEGSGHAIVHNEPRDNIKPFLDKKYDLIAIDHQKPQDKIAKIRDWQRILNWIRNEVPGVVAAAPTVNGNAVAVYGTKQMAIEVIGIEPRE